MNSLYFARMNNRPAPRTLADAFRGHDFGAAIEIYRVPLLTRFFRFFRSGM